MDPLPLAALAARPGMTTELVSVPSLPVLPFPSIAYPTYSRAASSSCAQRYGRNDRKHST